MDWSRFQRNAELALEFLDDDTAAAQIASRVTAQYAPAVLAAPDSDAEERAWEALRYYLTVRPTMRKPFALSDTEAQQVIDELRPLVDAERDPA
ncbi:MAG: hypothetical protein WD533_00910 [Dehalococcoidia bacterium]